MSVGVKKKNDWMQCCVARNNYLVLLRLRLLNTRESVKSIWVEPLIRSKFHFRQIKLSSCETSYDKVAWSRYQFIYIFGKFK